MATSGDIDMAVDTPHPCDPDAAERPGETLESTTLGRRSLIKMRSTVDCVRRRHAGRRPAPLRNPGSRPAQTLGRRKPHQLPGQHHLGAAAFDRAARRIPRAPAFSRFVTIRPDSIHAAAQA
jgi:hypothetical protein